MKAGATPLAVDPGFAVGKPKAVAAIVAPVLVADTPVIVSARKGGGSSVGKPTTHFRAKTKTVTKCTKVRGKNVCKKVKVAVKLNIPKGYWHAIPSDTMAQNFRKALRWLVSAK